MGEQENPCSTLPVREGLAPMLAWGGGGVSSVPRAWGDTLHSGLDRWDFRLNGWFREEQQFKAPLAKLYTSISKGLNALFRLHFRTAICGARGRGTRRGVRSHQWLLLSTAADLKGL